MGSYLDVANSPVVFLIVLVPVIFVLVQDGGFRCGRRGCALPDIHSLRADSLSFLSRLYQQYLLFCPLRD